MREGACICVCGGCVVIAVISASGHKGFRLIRVIFLRIRVWSIRAENFVCRSCDDVGAKRVRSIRRRANDRTTEDRFGLYRTGAGIGSRQIPRPLIRADPKTKIRCGWQSALRRSKCKKRNGRICGIRTVCRGTQRRRLWPTRVCTSQRRCRFHVGVRKVLPLASQDSNTRPRVLVLDRQVHRNTDLTLHLPRQFQH